MAKKKTQGPKDPNTQTPKDPRTEGDDTEKRCRVAFANAGRAMGEVALLTDAEKKAFAALVNHNGVGQSTRTETFRQRFKRVYSDFVARREQEKTQAPQS